MIVLTPEEQFAFAALTRWLVRIDGTFTAEEMDAVEKAAMTLLTTRAEDPYRGSTQAVRPDSSSIWALVRKAGEEVRDEVALRRTAQNVVEPRTRQLIYDTLLAIAAADAIGKEERPFFEWLAKEWGIARGA